MGFKVMISVMIVYFSILVLCSPAGLTATSSSSFLRILDKHPDCNKRGLSNCKINSCSDVDKVERSDAPARLLWNFKLEKPRMENQELVPVVNVSWEIQAEASIYKIVGSKVTIVDENTNQSLCVQFSYSFNRQLTPDEKTWTFSLDVVVEPRHTYTMAVFNLPEPREGDYRRPKPITIPGCDDRRLQKVQMCQENGSLWNPEISAVLTDKKSSVLVTFNAGQYSERYQVFIQNGDLNCSKSVYKVNSTLLNVTFADGSCQLSKCEVMVMIQPFFLHCKTDCKNAKKKVILCPDKPRQRLITKTCMGLLLVITSLTYFLRRAFLKGPSIAPSSADKQEPEVFHVQGRKRVLIIYSLDHLLYKNIVLKFCAFLMTKCGTDVVLDLLDLTRLGALGSVQWLDWHKQQIENSSDKILILCSRGVQAKWRAMCGDRQIFLREDARSPMGDMLTPSLSLLVPHFIRSQSFEKYIVAYFDGVCSEEDIPLPFNIAVRYKLMKQFEEVFFRILNKEKHEPGRVKQVNGLSEDKYHQCSSGRALRDAIEAFSAHQLEHPQWFEDELLKSSDLEDEEITGESDGNKTTSKNHMLFCVLGSSQVVSHVEMKESGLTVKKTEPDFRFGREQDGCVIYCSQLDSKINSPKLITNEPGEKNQ